ncbi:hypothetical protein GX48_05559 [Paracoccidioides brasiliensis]|nr:hypothetical protein GX48_05559 [Paracoccidioides brasiliensis]
MYPEPSIPVVVGSPEQRMIRQVPIFNRPSLSPSVASAFFSTHPRASKVINQNINCLLITGLPNFHRRDVLHRHGLVHTPGEKEKSFLPQWRAECKNYWLNSRKRDDYEKKREHCGKSLKHSQKRKNNSARRSSDDDVKKQKQIQSQQHCHNSFTPVMSFLLAIRIVTDPTRTTQGAVTKPANQRVPSHITLWDSFIDKQMMVWERLNDNPSFLTEKLFPSKHQLEYVHQLITLITSEWDL